MQLFQKIILALMVLLLAGCAAHQLTKNHDGTYVFYKQDLAGIYGNANRFRSSMFKEADKLAKAEGKIVIPISMKEHKMGFGDFASNEYKFKLVEIDPESPPPTEENVLTNAKVSLAKDGDTLYIFNTGDNSSSVSSDSAQNPTNISYFDELLKLDELKTRGVITEEEFQIMKAKIISR